MTTNTAFTKIHAHNIEIFKQVCASAKTDMSPEEIDHLVTNLIEIRDVKAAANSAKARRIERMAAAKSNPQFNDIIKRVDAELQRLGFDDIDAFAKNGNLHKLNDAIRAAAMTDDNRFQLKANMSALGLID